MKLQSMTRLVLVHADGVLGLVQEGGVILVSMSIGAGGSGTRSGGSGASGAAASAGGLEKDSVSEWD
jgi:hypothetical protein